ncbi:MAG: hypothetical protein AAB686_02050 [Patescibacteria group bacterium]
MTKLAILTRSPRTRVINVQHLKSLIRRLFLFITRQSASRGPEAVLQSLLRGLGELNYAYKLNPPLEEIFSAETVYVPSEVEALKWAVARKKEGKIKKLVTGPNIVIVPVHQEKVIMDPAIDVVLVPSAWVKDFYCSFGTDFCKRIRIWAAGTEIFAPSGEKRDLVLIYKKETEENLFSEVVRVLQAARAKTEVLTYGNFRRQDYLHLLKQVKYMVYLTAFESQGLALHEAWMLDVPTLVWDRGYWARKDYGCKFIGDTNAPYLTPECGLEFKGADDFPAKLEQFLNNLSQFSPRRYSLENFTDKICAEKFVKIIQTL